MKIIVLFLILFALVVSQKSYSGFATLENVSNLERFKMDLAEGYIQIIGWEKEDIQIKAYEKYPHATQQTINFIVMQHESIMHLHQEDKGFSSYKIYVPYRLNLNLTVHGKGQIRVRNSTGEIVVNTTKAKIRLNELRGSAIVNSQSGDIFVDFKELHQDQQLAFSNTYGSVNLAFPTLSKATFLISSIKGDVYSDYELTLPSLQDKSQTIERDFLPLLNGRIKGELNGGGTIIPIHTLSGDVYIEKLISNSKGTDHEIN